MKKIVFITTHNWDTKRQGGFHKFAEATALAGIETVFFSFPRPYYGYFMKREQLNPQVIRTLKKGISYKVGSGSVLNVTFPTLRLPDAAGRFLPDGLMNFLLKKSLGSFRSFAKKFLAGADCFVFESCEGIAFVDAIRRLFPQARILYRPSDPMVYASVPERVKALERHILMTAELSLIVNQEGVESYKKSIPDFDQKVRYQVLSNGIDLASYKKSYPVPAQLEKKQTVLYVGAWEVEWPLLFEAAQKLPECNFVVVCPNYPSDKVLNQVEAVENLTYVPGIKPDQVPAWITNCSVVMVPYVTDFYKDRPLGITAKYYQAMAAGKPIVAYCDTPKLTEVGVAVTYSYEDFITAIQQALAKGSQQYQFDLKGR
ncbi:MAG: glycosyltransferase, partial [Spirochaetaceae bacterium]|nr:glycosyltransferase [Spirochaetaceae bacterium]